LSQQKESRNNTINHLEKEYNRKAKIQFIKFKRIVKNIKKHWKQQNKNWPFYKRIILI